ncbi:hypothetical protein GZH46_02725, partial [Fragariocoptes setiger]
YAFTPQQTLQSQARFVYKRLVLLKHTFYYKLQHHRRYNYCESRPYTRSDDWLRWSVRVRVVIGSLSQITLTTGFAVMILNAFSARASNASMHAVHDVFHWHLLAWQDYLFLVELWTPATTLSLSVGVVLVYFLFPIIELSLCLDEIKLKMCTAALLLRYTRPQLLHSFYLLARELNINDVDEINEIRHRRMQVLGDDCRIKSLPHFVSTFKFNTHKRYQQLILRSAAANYAHTVDKLLDDIYLDFYLFVHEFDAVHELASVLLYIGAATFIALMASFIYLSQYLTDFDTVVAIATSLEFVGVNLILISSSYLSSRSTTTSGIQFGPNSPNVGFCSEIHSHSVFLAITSRIEVSYRPICT